MFYYHPKMKIPLALKSFQKKVFKVWPLLMQQLECGGYMNGCQCAGSPLTFESCKGKEIKTAHAIINNKQKFKML